MSDVNQTPELITPAVYGILAGVFVLVLTVFVLFSTGSIIAVFILWLLIALIVVVLAYYEFIDLAQIADSLFPEEKKKKTQAAEGVQYARGATLLGGEVFHVSDNKFTFEEAPAVCAAYQAELATLEQIIESYNNGAEWCNYGWSVGGMALYPTQKETWQKLQGEVDNGKRTRCGRPGVNGGYFDPLNKFGVNCYGVKPKGEFNPPAPLPGTDPKKFREMVDKFKAMLKALSLSPYSRQEWSYRQPYGSQFEKKSQPNESGTGTVEKFTEYADEFTENVAKDSAYTASPLYLRGDQGPVGPKGEIGPAGPMGLSGPPGPAGPEGPQGGIGPAGVKGDTGPKGDKGDTGPKGDKGTDGKDGKSIDINLLTPEERKKITGVDGKTGPTGPTGPTGGTGPTGPSGSVDNATLTNRINELLKSIFGGDPNAVVAKKSDLTGFAKPSDLAGYMKKGDPVTVAGKTGEEEKNLSPGDYWAKTRKISDDSDKVPRGTVFNEMKNTRSIGINADLGFGALVTTVPWVDPSGGTIMQEFKTYGWDNQRLDRPIVWMRRSVGKHDWDKPTVPSWGAWLEIRPPARVFSGI